jgi:hypothetical protein
MNKLTFLPLAVALSSSTAAAAVVSYATTGYVNPSAAPGAGGAIFGTTTDVTGGVPANYATVSNGAYVDFVMGDEENGGATAAHLRVSVDNYVGTEISPSNFNLMVARTSNSQGLTDNGSISILFQGLNSAEITFSWFTPDGTFTTPLANEYTITSFDIDFLQSNGIETSKLAQLYLADDAIAGPGNDTRLLTRTVGAFTEAYDPAPGTNSTVNDVRNAVAFRAVTSSEQTMRVAKNATPGQALFIFEFRNPPGNFPAPLIPEPSSSLMVGLAGLGLLARRRRR